MNTFYFGTSEKALYGVYHPPRGEPRDEGVVLCAPMGQEYIRAHRAFRGLAALLAKKRFHVLRFDYYGTGDSAGDCSAGTFDQWVEDIGTAVEELRDTSGAGRISLVGLRMGATLAARACERRDDVDAIVLWDPIVEGPRYILELLESNRRQPGFDPEAARRLLDGPEPIGILGFPLTAAMRRDLRAVDLGAVPPLLVRRAYIVGSSDRPEYAAIGERLRGHGVQAEYRCIPGPGNWGFVDNNGSALLPQAIIQGIAETLGGEAGR